jgi:hypothetical protein
VCQAALDGGCILKLHKFVRVQVMSHQPADLAQLHTGSGPSVHWQLVAAMLSAQPCDIRCVTTDTWPAGVASDHQGPSNEASLISGSRSWFALSIFAPLRTVQGSATCHLASSHGHVLDVDQTTPQYGIHYTIHGNTSLHILHAQPQPQQRLQPATATSSCRDHGGQLA